MLLAIYAPLLGERVRISVQDTGIGIPADDLARLAKPFEPDSLLEAARSLAGRGGG